MTENQFINASIGIVYIYDYDLTNFELLQCGLKESKIIGDVEIAKWITPRNPLSNALRVTFHQLIPPEYIDVLVERVRTKVYECHDLPMMFKKCLENNHTARQRTYNDVICDKCASKGHEINTLMGWAVDEASVPIGAGHFWLDVSVYAISIFYPYLLF